MPKYKKICNNPLHDGWSKGQDDQRNVNLKAHGLSEIANAFCSLMKQEFGAKSPSVNHVCRACLQQCLKMRVFRKYLPRNCEAIKCKVEKQV